MLAKLTTYALVGIDALPVEVDTAHGLPKTVLVGLPEMAVKESIERAMANLGYTFPKAIFRERSAIVAQKTMAVDAQPFFPSAFVYPCLRVTGR